MTMLCVPAKSFPSYLEEELCEINYSTHKALYRRNRELAFIDLDWKSDGHILRAFPQASLIVSYHNLEETPADLDQCLKSMRERYPHATYYKIATLAQSTNDALRMLRFSQSHSYVIALCMGKLGQITRILAPVVSNPIMYAPRSEEEETASGQMLLHDLHDIYHFRKLNPETALYGLIGNPVSQSIGHLFHNEKFQAANYNGVYVKMTVEPHQLESFLDLAHKVGFQGLSVTSPLKESVIPYLKEIDPWAEKTGAVNTLVSYPRGWKGFNTDGKAAVASIGNVQGKRITILGAGGAARAIAYAALENRAYVTIANRTLERAQKIAQSFDCAWSSLDCLPPYDILVNATTHALPIDAKHILPSTILSDISLQDTQLIHQGRQKGCLCHNGHSMFERQAIHQRFLWNLL